MKINLTGVYVVDQEKADFSQAPFRWLTVTSPENPDGAELQLALNDNPAELSLSS